MSLPLDFENLKILSHMPEMGKRDSYMITLFCYFKNLNITMQYLRRLNIQILTVLEFLYSEIQNKLFYVKTEVIIDVFNTDMISGKRREKKNKICHIKRYLC